MVRNRKPVIVLDTGLGQYKDLLLAEGFKVYHAEDAERFGFDSSDLKSKCGFFSGWIFMTYQPGVYEPQQLEADFDLILVPMEAELEKVAKGLGRWAADYKPREKQILWKMEIDTKGEMVSFVELPKEVDGDGDPDRVIWNQLSPQTKELLMSISPREERRLRERFGKDGDADDTILEDGGKDFFASRDRLREIERKALRKLETMKEKENQTDGTIRQKMIELLKVRPWDAGGLSRALGISQRMVESHLNHVGKSVEAQGLRWVIDPSRCGECDFRFVGRDRTTKPSRCPKCKCEQIVPPMFSVEDQPEGGG